MTDERRVVTILFADVTGSTALGEALDPEDLRALLSRYYSIAKDVVAAHGGTVEKFIGDAVMAVFGLRRAHGDDAVRALAAAIELRDRVQSDARLGERLPIRLGVNTGDVIASRDPGSDDFLVTGDAVNIAARIQQNAAPWSIIVGERSVRAVRADFRFSPAQPVEAKGKSEPLMVSELLGRSHSIAGRTPIFGRDADLAQMDLVARRAFEEQRPFMVSVIAPAGTGKTRLLEEFLDRLRKSSPKSLVAIAQCLPYGQRLTYWPLRAVLFRVVGADEDASAEDIRNAVDRWLTDAGVDDPTGVGRLLVSTIGEGDSETSDRASLFAAWRTFIEAASRQAPLVVVVEDLHWSSDTLLDLFEFVLQPRADTRALLIALTRPELLDRRPNWGGGRRNHISIALEPLDDRATAQLVRTVAEGAPDALVDAIVTRAEGNPFFAGEIVSAVLERVKSFGDPAQIEAALERLPDTVQATVLARLDELPEQEREILRVGSVFGRSFRPAGVAALLGRDGVSGETVGEIAERLAERDLVRPSGADGYAFRHILIREVAYSTLPRATRAALHGAAGRWLAERAAGREEALAELVAYHFREAATLATAMERDDVEELRDAARTWLVKAALVARSAAATAEARNHVEAAVGFARADDLPELYELFGDVEVGGTPSVSLYEKALQAGRDAGRSSDFVLRMLAKQLMVEMRSLGSVANRRSGDDLERMRREARELLDNSNDDASRALFLAADAFYPFWARTTSLSVSAAELQKAADEARTAIELARSVDDANIESAGLDALASLAQERGQWRETIDIGRQRLALGTRLALYEQIDAYAVMTWGAVLAGDLTVADDVSEAGLAIIQPGQAPEWTIHLVAWRVVALLLHGQWERALTTADQAYRLWIEAGRPAAGYSMRGFLAALLVARARRDEARQETLGAVIRELDADFEADPRFVHIRNPEANDLPRIADALSLPNGLGSMASFEQQALSLSACNDGAEPVAQAPLEAGLARSRAYQAPLFEAEVLRSIGLNNQDRVPLAEAHEIFQRCQARPYEARTGCEIALLNGDREAFDAGVAYLESIGDVLQIERYHKRWSTRRG